MRTLFAVVALAGACIGAALAGEAKTAGQKYPAFEVGMLNDAALEEMPSGVLAKVNDKKITKKYLEAKIAEAPAEEKEMFEQTKPFLLAQLVQREALLGVARREGFVKEGADETAENSAIQAMVKKRVDGVKVTDEELRKLYEKHKGELGGASFDESKEMLREYLTNQKQQEILTGFLKEVSRDTKVSVNEKWAAEQNAMLTDNPLDKGRQSGKITMVEFGADWCAPCKQLAPIIKEVEKEQKDVNVVVINVDKNRELSLRYAVRNLPTLVYFSADGKEVYRQEGLTTKKDIVSKLESIRKGKAAGEAAPDDEVHKLAPFEE